jgi:hypothetical protein
MVEWMNDFNTEPIIHNRKGILQAFGQLYKLLKEKIFKTTSFLSATTESAL